MRAPLFLAAAFVGLLSVGCAPEIGDGCETSIDCSVNNDRICDISQPGGYCTVRACDPDTCPEEGTCVEWRYDPDRTSVTYCMKRCSDDGDCRGGYQCLASSDPELVDLSTGSPIARVVDLDRDPDTTKFCVAEATVTPAAETPDSGTSTPADSGTESVDDAGTADAGLDMSVDPDADLGA
ncbi:MAG: hypothetical protein CMN30_11370 [Sandaracinus sp.]|nr:hypothetical protein [Sandaracinus sp.]|tara:strand:- start:3922 stop:4464 length:543 start_codon:yes stop_codon:yes gene_type:complete